MKVTTKINGKTVPTKAEREENIQRQRRDEMTLNKAFQEFYVENFMRLSTYTLQSYENCRKNHLRAIMNWKVDDLTNQVIQEAFDKEKKLGYKFKTRRNFKYMVKQVLKLVRPDFHTTIVIEGDDMYF